MAPNSSNCPESPTAGPVPSPNGELPAGEEKLGKKRSPNLLLSQSSSAEPQVKPMDRVLLDKWETFIEVRQIMGRRTAHLKTAGQIEMSCPFYGQMEWLALKSIIAERREQEHQPPRLKRKRLISSSVVLTDSDGDVTEPTSNNGATTSEESNDPDYNPSTHEHSSDSEDGASSGSNTDSLVRGPPKKKARTIKTRTATSTSPGAVHDVCNGTAVASPTVLETAIELEPSVSQRIIRCTESKILYNVPVVLRRKQGIGKF
ncbi:hypothetical protein C8Q78DRAFT_995587 [Trametes maxima]|nr:hypothetical protein C8Q78DRAFT_995587 [Trametes maxima]